MLSITDVRQLYLGIQGENLAQTITIDMRPWMVAHPEGSVTIWHKRNGDTVPSATGAVFDDVAGTISWSPTDTDTSAAGEGTAEIRLTEGTVIKKSRSVRTLVSPAVTLSGTPQGSGWQDYINIVDGMRAEAVAAGNEASLAVSRYPYVDEDSYHWMVWDLSDGEWKDTGIDGRGVQGDPGRAGPQGPKGDRGADGIVVLESAYTYSVHVNEDGDLILTI